MPKGSEELTHARKEEIIDACAALYETMGFRDITIRDIGAKTSFTRTSIYNYFQTKEEIFLALLQREHEAWIADLEELAHTPVMVICAGAKSILDLGLTLEYLETHGVPVIGYGTEELPAFYTRKSGFKVDYRVDSPEELAELFRTSAELGVESGILVTNPIPEEYSMDPDVINKAISEAVDEANAKGIHGNKRPPELLGLQSHIR